MSSSLSLLGAGLQLSLPPFLSFPDLPTHPDGLNSYPSGTLSQNARLLTTRVTSFIALYDINRKGATTSMTTLDQLSKIFYTVLQIKVKYLLDL